MTQNLLLSFGLAGILRLFLFGSNFAESIRNRIEVSTPLNSWKRSNYILIQKSHQILYPIEYLIHLHSFFRILSSRRCISLWEGDQSILRWLVSWESVDFIFLQFSVTKCKFIHTIYIHWLWFTMCLFADANVSNIYCSNGE